jgi:hypothetical protein
MAMLARRCSQAAVNRCTFFETSIIHPIERDDLAHGIPVRESHIINKAYRGD